MVILLLGSHSDGRVVVVTEDLLEHLHPLLSQDLTVLISVGAWPVVSG